MKTRPRRFYRWFIPSLPYILLLRVLGLFCAQSGDLLAWDFPTLFADGLSTPPGPKFTRTSPLPRLASCPDIIREKELVHSQLGYVPTNFVRVSAWTVTGTPVAIQTYPLQGGAKRRQAKSTKGRSDSLIQSPFPTLYWLTCPEVSRCVADLERRGFIQRFEARLHGNSEMMKRLWRCHRQYADQRWQTLAERERELLMETTDTATLRMRDIMRESGISGTNLTITDSSIGVPAIKCLHAHYAHFRSTIGDINLDSNPVGEMIHEELKNEFPFLQL